MDGYTVDEAASVLGVPQARVWELLARGVLAGAPEGESGMRVYLKGGVGEEVTNRPERAEPGRGSNGNGGHHGPESGEMTPFRELLTEFRNLTERYGQALLALGEARGEVASLRSRVELLEARIDLRLPSSRPASTVAWEMSDYAASRPPTRTDDEAVPEPEAEAEAATAPEADRAAEPEPIGPVEGFAGALPADELPADELLADEALGEEFLVAEEIPVADRGAEGPAPEAAPAVAPAERATSRRKRLHPGREAMSGLAEALARAQDPTLADLPGVREAAEALAELRREIDAGVVAQQVAEELPDATADVVEESESITQVQPDAVAVEEPEPIAAAAIPLEEIAPDEEAVLEVQVAFEGEAAPREDVVGEMVTFEEEPVVEEESFSEAAPYAAEAADTEELPGEAPAFEEEILQVADVAMPEEKAAVTEEVPSEAPAFEGEAAAAEAPSAEAPGFEEGAAVEEELPTEPPAFEEEIPQVVDVAMPEEEAAAEEAAAEELPGEAVSFEGVARLAEEPPGEAPEVAEEISQVAGVAMGESAVEREPAPTEGAAPHADLSAPHEEPSAPEPVVPPSHYTTDVVEPDWFADGDFTWLEAAEAERLGAGVEAEGPAEVHEEAPADVVTAEAAATQPPGPFEEAESPEASVGTGPVVEPIETPPPEAALPETELASAELPTPEGGGPAAEREGELVAESPAESVIEETPPATASSAHEEEAPAAFIDEAWNEPTGEPMSAEPAAATAAATAELEPAEAAASVEPTGASLGDEWPLDLEPSQSTPAVAASTEPAEESRPSPSAGDALGGFRAASAEELGPPPQGPARAGEEELMWLGDEFEAAGLEIASQGWRDEGHPVEADRTKPPVFELSDAELTRLAQDEGWNLDEVNAIRAFLGRPGEGKQAASEPVASEPMESAASTAEAVEAVEAVESTEEAPHEPTSTARQAVPEGEPPPGENAEPAPPVDVPSETMGAAELSRRLAAHRASPPDTSHPDAPGEPRSLPGQPDPEWLHGRRGPAATAYRRLRRLFPG